MNLDAAIVYDIETFPNCFTLHMEALNSDASSTWEISAFRDDRQYLLQWFNYLQQIQAPMIGFNSVGFDYPVIHAIFSNPQITIAQIYEKAQSIITSNDRFANTIWERDRFAPQIDLFKIHHFDNKAKTTSLKALQINMRSPTVVETPIPFGTVLTAEQIATGIIPYNVHDVKQTKQFAHHSMEAIKFRLSLVETMGVEVMNYNDTKIGEKMLINRMGEEVCFERRPRLDGDTTGRRSPRQTPRSRIALDDVIMPYIRFDNPEFNRVLDYLRTQVLLPDEIADIGAEIPTIKTKGVFTGLKAHVGGVDFKFGTGGIHASVTPQRIIASEEWLIRDIDVKSLYPNFGIVNRIAPEHLGAAFTREYSKLPIEREQWQKKKGKKCVEANAIKLGANGAYGKSNDKFSCLYDPLYTMTVTINCQLVICMLAEWLLAVPTLQIIQANTDGITYRIHANYEPQAAEVCKQWEQFTMLQLESVDYSRMFIRDVNNYVAENKDGALKCKGAYEYPDPLNYAGSISVMQPPGWHKDWSAVVSTRAAVAAMVHGINPEIYIRAHTDPFDFMCRIKVNRSDRLLLGGRETQKTCRYYVATDGAAMVKIAPPAKGAQIGDYKRKNGLTDREFNDVLATLAPGTWDARIHTGNKSKYELRETQIEAGWKIAECNDASAFSFDKVDYSWYVEQARKLII